MDLHATIVPLDNLLVAGRHVQPAPLDNLLVAGGHVQTAPLENFLVAGVRALIVEQVEVTPTNKHRHRTQEILTIQMVDLHFA